jgi:hypothetical protein
LERAIPLAKELPGYQAPTARRDLLAGVTVAALAIPAIVVILPFLTAPIGDPPKACSARRSSPPRQASATSRRGARSWAADRVEVAIATGHGGGDRERRARGDRVRRWPLDRRDFRASEEPAHRIS